MGHLAWSRLFGLSRVSMANATEHHVWSRMCQDVQKERMFKDRNLSMCEPKELVTERHCWPSAEDT